MKILWLSILITLHCGFIRAQTPQDTTICAKLYSYKKISKGYYLLNMGGYYPDQQYTAVLTGYQDVRHFLRYKDSVVCMAGKLEQYRGKPQLRVAGRFQYYGFNNRLSRKEK